MDDDPVVRPDRVRLEPELVADLGPERQSPGGVDATAEGREHAQPPVADLVAEALDDDRPVRRHHAGGRLLFAQVFDEVARRAGVEVVLGLESLGGLIDRPARERPDRLTELARASHPISLPEGHRARQARRRGDDYPVAANLLDTPRRGAEEKGLPGAGLVDHLLVELTDAPTVGKSDRVQAPVGDRAGIGDR